jgi:hypothetical protein
MKFLLKLLNDVMKFCAFKEDTEIPSNALQYECLLDLYWYKIANYIVTTCNCSFMFNNLAIKWIDRSVSVDANYELSLLIIFARNHLFQRFVRQRLHERLNNNNTIKIN